MPGNDILVDEVQTVVYSHSSPGFCIGSAGECEHQTLFASKHLKGRSKLVAALVPMMSVQSVVKHAQGTLTQQLKWVLVYS